MTGIVTASLIALIQDHIHRSQVVVWFDPDQHYTGFVAALDLPGVHKANYDPRQGYLRLRRDLEPFWSKPQRPKLLIYAAVPAAAGHNPLVEYIENGAVLAPSAHPPECNTRLSVVARRALEHALPAASLEKIIADLDAGRLSLSELDAIAEKGLEVQSGALAVVFGTGAPEEIALRFLTDPALDAELAARAAGQALAGLLGEATGASLGEGAAGDGGTLPGADLPALRAALGRRLLLTEFLESLTGGMQSDGLPAALKTIPLPESPAARQTAVRIVRNWRLRRDLAPAYVQAAKKVEADLALAGQPGSIAGLKASETFAGTETTLQALVEAALLKKPDPELIALAGERGGGFWSAQRPEIQARWRLIRQAGHILVRAGQVAQALKAGLSAEAMIEKYACAAADAAGAEAEAAASCDAPWCELDETQRQMERDFHNFDFDAGHETLEQLAAAARLRYAAVANEMSTHFIRAYEAAGFGLSKIQPQGRVFADVVTPARKTGRVAYLLVDAFRYEMAGELCRQLTSDWKVALKPALATPPTITEIGMAALLPGAERGIGILPAGSGKLAAQIQNTPLKNRAERMKFLEAQVAAQTTGQPDNGAAATVSVVELNMLAPLKDKKLRSKLANADLVIVTASDEIDGLWEYQPHMARQLQDHVFDQLRRGLRTLFSLGIKQAIISADHGYLFGNTLAPGEPVDPPGGETADLHRRVWIGKGGASMPGFLRRPLSQFGLSGDLELVTPYNLSIFKSQGGSLEYFHGGLSLQELIVPVMTVTPGGNITEESAPFRWELVPGSPVITTRFFSVTIQGEAGGMFGTPPALRVELRSGGQVVSQPVAATYGFNDATLEVAMQFSADKPTQLVANTVTLLITDIPQVSSLTLHLIDEIGASLKQKDVAVDIAM